MSVCSKGVANTRREYYIISNSYVFNTTLSRVISIFYVVFTYRLKAISLTCFPCFRIDPFTSPTTGVNNFTDLTHISVICTADKN